MMEPALWVALVALVAMLMGCYFAACSAALRTFSRSRLGDLLEARGHSDRFEPFLARLPKLTLMIATLRTSLNLIVLLAILWIFQDDATPDPWLYVAAFVLAGTIISVFAVAVPVSVARYRGEQLLAWSMSLLQGCLVIFMPLANALHMFDPIMRRILGGQSEPAPDERLTEEILSVVEDHEEEAAVDENQKDMLEGVIELRSTTAEQIMTPRTEVKGIEDDASIDEVKKAILELGHSRIPVYRESLDHIVGILYAKDMIKFLGNGEPWKIPLREPFLVPESKSVNELLAEFKARKVHMAIVLDEYGGTAGLVTIEDVLEEIVGEIHDEYEPSEEVRMMAKVDERVVEVDARVRVHDLNDEFDLELPEHEDYDTVGGFVFSTLGHIPEAGESFDFQDIRVTVTEAERTKVSRVRMEVLESQPTLDLGNGNHR